MTKPAPPKRSGPTKERNHLTSLIVRLPPDLKDNFNRACWSQRLFASEVMRDLMRQYVEENL